MENNNYVNLTFSVVESVWLATQVTFQLSSYSFSNRNEKLN